MHRVWTRTSPEGDTVTVTLDALGATVSVLRITGAREHDAVSFEEFERAWMPWLEPQFDDVWDELVDALAAARAEAEYDDDAVP